ncbi:hypothetical protein GCM10010303_64020 [Streptomyces purpurascens]|nr:hypothetical protein GCM10010303_64020 [Streptomyces purpurascens]
MRAAVGTFALISVDNCFSECIVPPAKCRAYGLAGQEVHPRERELGGASLSEHIHRIERQDDFPGPGRHRCCAAIMARYQW